MYLRASQEKERTMQAILLFSQPYKITDQNTGQINEGISIWIHGRDSLKPLERETNKGIKPFKANLPIKFASKILSVPGLYDVDYVIEGGGQTGKGQANVIDIEFLSELETKQINSVGK